MFLSLNSFWGAEIHSTQLIILLDSPWGSTLVSPGPLLTPFSSYILISAPCSPECCLYMEFESYLEHILSFCLGLFLCIINIFFFHFPFAALVKNVKFSTTWSFRKHLSVAYYSWHDSWLLVVDLMQRLTYIGIN